MSLNGAITNLASWAGNTMMPTMAGMFFASAVYRYSKSSPFEHLLYGGFASLMCSGMLRALEGFVQHGGATSPDGFWMATMSLVNWTANVILPIFRANPTCGHGPPYGRCDDGDISRFQLDSQVHRRDRRIDGFGHGSFGRIHGDACARHIGVLL